jgi:hypothetical protein
MILTEKKDHIISKIPALSPEQKSQIIQYFNVYPNEEGQIDWNNWKNLKYEDFTSLINSVSRTAKKKNVKNSGIEGLIPNEDYVEVYNQDNIIGYVPLTHEASKLIASKYINGIEGTWCTAENSAFAWKSYCKKLNKFLIYFINYNPKFKWKKIAILANSKKTSVFEDYTCYSSTDLIINLPLPFTLTDMTSIIAHARVGIQKCGGIKMPPEKKVCVTQQINRLDKYTIEVIHHYDIRQKEKKEGKRHWSILPGQEVNEKIIIKQIGKGVDVRNNADFLYLDFSIMNGTGFYINDKEYNKGEEVRKLCKLAGSTVDDMVYMTYQYYIASIIQRMIPPPSVDFVIWGDDRRIYNGQLNYGFMANLSRYLFSISWSDIKDKVFHDRLSREGYTIYYDKYYDFHNKIFDMVMLPSQNILQENTTLFGL